MCGYLPPEAQKVLSNRSIKRTIGIKIANIGCLGKVLLYIFFTFFHIHFIFCSFHEVGVYDLAAAVDFVTMHTNQSKVTLIGHSAGGNMFLALLSERPEYNDKVKVAICWASSPIITLENYNLLVLVIQFGDFYKV